MIGKGGRVGEGIGPLLVGGIDPHLVGRYGFGGGGGGGGVAAAGEGIADFLLDVGNALGRLDPNEEGGISPLAADASVVSII